MANIKVRDVDRKLLGLKIKVGMIETQIASFKFRLNGEVEIELNYHDTYFGMLFLKPNDVLDIYGSADDRDMPQVILDQREEDAHEREIIV